MKFKRMINLIGLCLQRGAKRRGDYLRKHHVFASVGENVRYQPRKIPLYGELIRIGSNVAVGSNTSLITHDAIHLVYNSLPDRERKLSEKADCIEIGDNVFIGARTIILGNVRIGSNTIVSAGSVVNKDLESGGVYGGVPARRIGDFDAFWEKRLNTPYQAVSKNQKISPEEVETAWKHFYQAREAEETEQ
ncbi:MAG: acyltransferase [Oscillospiraceae bacterium]|nr:acyltransferase [Lachnospiraceae bacterium]MBQ6428038.1 acyltransferase [Oscillospiraceae bacterium]